MTAEQGALQNVESRGGKAVATKPRTSASYETELARHRGTESRLRVALTREYALRRETEELIQRRAVLCEESDHRFLNSLQMIASLLSMQSRTAASSETASQLKIAANRVATIGRIHRHLHCFDDAQSVAFKTYLEDICHEFSSLMGSDAGSAIITVDADEAELPTQTSIPLAFIVNELITNAAKYGEGQITVSLKPHPRGHTLSVSNDGAPLPDNFDPSASKGLGMRIIRSLVERIGGELQITRADREQGASFKILFS